MAVLDDAHLVARLAVQLDQVLRVAHGHDAHTVGPGVGLDDDEGLFLDAVFLVLAADLAEQRFGVAHQAFLPRAIGEIHFAATREQRVNEPRVHAEQLGEFLRDLFIGLEVIRLAPHRPAGVQRRQQVLLVDVLQYLRDAGRQVVVEQDRAGVEVLQPEPPAVAHQGLERQCIAVGQVDLRRRFDAVVERAQAHVEPGLMEDLHQPRDVAQVERIARVLLGNQQQVARFGTDFFDRGHRRLHGERQHLGRQVVEAAGEQVGVDRRELESGVAQVDRGVERRRVLHPLEAKPALDGRQRLEHALLQLVDRASERSDEVRNHETSPRVAKGATILGIWGMRCRLQGPHTAHEKGPPRGGPCDVMKRQLTCCTPSRRAR